MNRRSFFQTSAGLAATLAAPGVWRAGAFNGKKKRYDFVPYKGRALAPVTRVTPDDGFYVHTYYDLCPWSASGRYLAVTRLPYQDRNAVWGDTAEVCLIDLKERTIETVHRTKVWGFQTGALANWGGSDRYLYTNDMVNGVAVCARIDLEAREVKLYSGPQYNVAPDDSAVISFPLELMDITQVGYGAPQKDPKNPAKLPVGASATQGLWRTDMRTGEKRLLMSLKKLSEAAPPAPRKDGTWYLWHCRYNRQGTRILQISRTLFPAGLPGRNTMVFTFNTDGTDVRWLPTEPKWGTDGGHPNWHGDGQRVIRNIKVDGVTRLVEWKYDGTGFRVMSGKFEGGGHPRVEPSGRFLVTDAFQGPELTLRWLDLKAGKEEPLVVIATFDKKAIKDEVLRLDGHPSFDRNFKQICFQAAPEGRRQLYVADVGKLIS